MDKFYIRVLLEDRDAISIELSLLEDDTYLTNKGMPVNSLSRLWNDLDDQNGNLRNSLKILPEDKIMGIFVSKIKF